MSHDEVTRSIQLSSSLHFASLADYRAAGDGKAVLKGQTAEFIDNGYGLQGNPTMHQLQDAISELEKGKHTLLYPSGMTALTALVAFLKTGDHWLIPDTVYAPMRRLADYLSENYGIEYSLYNSAAIDTLHGLIRDETKLIHIETPSSATFEVVDMAGIVKLAKSKGILTSADNTWAAGVLLQPLDHGVDISILSLTKYPSGYSDVFMGSVTTKDSEVYKKLAYHHRVYSYTVSPFSVMLVNRGLESLKVRLAAHGAQAAKLIDSLKDHKKVTKIYYVDPAKSPEFSGMNSLFSLELDRVYTDEELGQALSGLDVFQIGESWGGTRSLVLPFQPDEFKTRFAPPKNTIIRFHTGFEDLDAQTADISKILKSISSF